MNITAASTSTTVTVAARRPTWCLSANWQCCGLSHNQSSPPNLLFLVILFFFFWMLGVGWRYWFNAHQQGLRYRERSWSKMAFSKSTSSPSSLSFSFSMLNSFMRFKYAWWRWGLTLLLLKLSDKSRVGVSCFLTYHLC